MSNQPYPIREAEGNYGQNQMNNQPNQGQGPRANYVQHQQRPISMSEPGYQEREVTEQAQPVRPQYEGYGYPAHTPAPNYQSLPSQGSQLPYNGQNYGADGIVRTSNMGGMYTENRYQTYRDAMGNVIESQQQVFENQNQLRANIRYWSTTILSFLLGVLEVILLLRFVFRLLGASMYNNFIIFLYGLSHPFVAAFNGIFNNYAVGKYGVFEVSTLIAMLVYALLIWGLISLVRIVFAPIQSSKQRVTTTHRSQY